MIINILVYFKVIKNIFGTNESDDYQVLSEKLQNFLLCLEMVVAAAGHHYSYPYHEHQINIPNYRPANNFRQLLGPIFDVNDIMQDVREHMGAVKNSLTRPFRSADPFQESKLLLATGSRRGSAAGKLPSHMNTNNYRYDDEPVAGPSSSSGSGSRYGTVNYVANKTNHSTIPIAPPQASQYHQGAPPLQFGNMFRQGEGEGSSGGSSSRTSTNTITQPQQALKKSESSNTVSWPSNSISDDVIQVKGPEENLIQLPDTPPL